MLQPLWLDQRIWSGVASHSAQALAGAACTWVARDGLTRNRRGESFRRSMATFITPLPCQRAVTNRRRFEPGATMAGPGPLTSSAGGESGQARRLSRVAARKNDHDERYVDESMDGRRQFHVDRPARGPRGAGRDRARDQPAIDPPVALRWSTGLCGGVQRLWPREAHYQHRFIAYPPDTKAAEAPLNHPRH